MFKNKKKFLILLVVIIIMSTFILVGCESFSQKAISGGDATAKTENNGGLTVKQGNYIYFINGKSDVSTIKVPKDNYFGNVLKGSIMRGTVKDNGTIADYKVIVPKLFYSSYTKSGLTIFGEWIYYSTPSTATDNNGVVQTTYTEYFRTKIDGTKTQKITRIEGQDTQHKFMSNAFIYFKDGTLRAIPYTNKKVGKEFVVVEEVSAVYFADNAQEYVVGSNNIGDFIFYTKASTDVYATNAITYATKAEKDFKPFEVFNAKSHTDVDNDSKNIFSIEIKRIVQENDKLVMYYGKSNSYGGASRKFGLYSHTFTNTELKFNKTNEVQYTEIDTPTSIYKIDEKTILVYDAAEIYFAYMQDGKAVKDKITLSAVPKILKIAKETVPGTTEQINYLYYINGSKLEKAPLVTGKDHTTIIIAKEIDSTWMTPELIGDKVFYINSKYGYTHYADLSTFDASTKKITDVMVGEMTTADSDKKIADDKKQEETDGYTGDHTDHNH